MISKVVKILNPDRYQGTNRKKSFFVVWYYKVVSADEAGSFAIIPGIFLDKDIQKSISFIQVIDAISRNSYYIDSPIDLFKASKNKFEIDIPRLLKMIENV